MPFLSPNQQCQSTEGKIRNIKYGYYVCITYDSVPWKDTVGRATGRAFIGYELANVIGG